MPEWKKRREGRVQQREVKDKAGGGVWWKCVCTSHSEANGSWVQLGCVSNWSDVWKRFWRGSEHTKRALQSCFLSYPFKTKMRKKRSLIQKRKEKKSLRIIRDVLRAIGCTLWVNPSQAFSAASHLPTSRPWLLNNDGLPQPDHLKFNEDVCYFSHSFNFNIIHFNKTSTEMLLGLQIAGKKKYFSFSPFFKGYCQGPETPAVNKKLITRKIETHLVFNPQCWVYVLFYL